MITTQQPNVSIQQLVNLLSNDTEKYICVKDKQSNYTHANARMANMLGFNDPRGLTGLTDFQLTPDPVLAKRYRELDEQTLDCKQKIDTTEVVIPADAPHLRMTMQGYLAPLTDLANNDHVIIVVEQKVEVHQHDLHTLLCLSTQQFFSLLKKYRYPIQANWGLFYLSRREIQCIREIILNKHAGEIAQTIGLKQTTVESYITNIKAKLNITTKSELVDAVISNAIFAQIFKA